MGVVHELLWGVLCEDVKDIADDRIFIQFLKDHLHDLKVDLFVKKVLVTRILNMINLLTELEAYRKLSVILFLSFRLIDLSDKRTVNCLVPF